MSNAKPLRTVSVTCACGASFTREAKRGRPQVWCESCREVPFYERVRAEAPVITTDEGVVIPVKPVNENDDLGLFRDQIEADVQAVYAEHKARIAALVEAGDTIHDAAAEASPILSDALVAVYAKYR